MSQFTQIRLPYVLFACFISVITKKFIMKTDTIEIQVDSYLMQSNMKLIEDVKKDWHTILRYQGYAAIGTLYNMDENMKENAE